tara:strand:+ start:407 stop:856 length:450 start_codon:yes stop_codon:yes gene_type:complete
MNLILIVFANFFSILFVLSFLNFFFKKNEIKNLFLSIIPVYLITFTYNVNFFKFTHFENTIIFFSTLVIFFVFLANLYRAVTIDILLFIYIKKRENKKKLLNKYDVNNFLKRRLNNIYSSKIYLRDRGLDNSGKILVFLYELSKRVYNK